LRFGERGVSSGLFTGAAGTALELGSYQPYILEPDSLIRVPNVVFAGSANLNGTYDVSESTSFRGVTVNINSEAVIANVGNRVTINSGGKTNFSSSMPITVTTLVLERGELSGVNDLTVTGVLTWTGGTMSGSGKTITTGKLVINQGNGYHGLARTLENHGLATWTGGAIYSDSGAIFNNLSGSTFDLQGDLASTNSGSTSATFNNAGLFRKSAGIGTAKLGLIFNNNGRVDIQVGTLRFGERGISSGQFTGMAGTTLEFASYQPYILERDSLIRVPNVVFAGRANLNGTYDVSESTTFLPNASGTDVNFNPEAVIVNVGNTLTINSNGKATFNTGLPITTTNLIMIGVNGSELAGASDLMVTGVLTWTGGRMSGPGKTISTGRLVMNQGINRRILARTVENHGLATWPEGDMYATSGGVLLNATGGTFDITGNGMFYWCDPGAGSCSFLGPQPTFVNAGRVIKSGGGVTKFSNPGNLAGPVTFNNRGVVEVVTGILDFGAYGGGYTQSAGTLSLSGGNIVVTGAMLNIQGGSLSGTGKITGPVTNAGVINLGASPGTLTIIGNYTQGASGTLNVEVGGLAVGSQFDQLSVSGQLVLAGTLNVTLINGFAPNSGDRFPIVTGGSRSGQFTIINELEVGNGKRFQVNHSASRITLDVVSASGVPSVAGFDVLDGYRLPSPQANSAPLAAPARGFNWATHSVEPHGTLWAIATAWGTTVDALLQLNPQIVDRDLIYPGQQIMLPACHSVACQALEKQYQRPQQGTDESPCEGRGCWLEHIVRSGENLLLIGATYSVPWQSIFDANRDVIGSDPNWIFPGQKLVISQLHSFNPT
jgi:hypothetical protein